MTFCDNAIKVLEAELAQVEVTATFLRSAMKARGSIGPLMNTAWWPQVQAHDRSLLKSYYDQGGFTADAVFRGLHVTIAAAFERFTRSVLMATVEHLAGMAKSIDDLPEGIRHKNMYWSGRLLTQVGDPPEEFAVDFQEVCRNLGTCNKDSPTLALNPATFTLDLPILSAEGLEKALDRITVDHFWDALGQSSQLQKSLNESKTRDAAKSLKDFLKNFSRTRNRIVHGADAQASVQDQNITDAIKVFRALAEALPNAIWKKLKLK